jgi:hypothetical protein
MLRAIFFTPSQDAMDNAGTSVRPRTLQRPRNVHKRPGSLSRAARSGFKHEKSAVTLRFERAARRAYVVRCANRRDRLFGISTLAPAAACGKTVNIPDTEAVLSLRADMPIGSD